MLQKTFDIISSTPIWVWGILVYLLFIGIKSLKDRLVYIPKLFIIPIILNLVKYKTFINANIQTLFLYAICLILSSYISYRMTNDRDFAIIPEKASVKLEGSASMLIILISFFIAKYFFGYIQSTNNILYSEIAILEIGLTGLFTGYFLGRALSFLHCFISLRTQIRK